ncbi:hypothetical protein [Williamsoniiplasma lucivorax]|uniref:Uncharacterized protein n=1 Tax=Williamsoniiplasma lucivorax TaxID=209274 RepID=A0A2S5RDM5_9MOLU|nr:hypothetical protein [Williamsoniiplasma lucivorax]PPE05398.1 hypothetical protein ELUCI_v1c04900 [Williamsoniiplasma lucivorax]
MSKKIILVSDETLKAKEIFQQEQTKLIKSLRNNFEESILDDVFNMSDQELLQISKERFDMLFEEIKSYKKHQIGDIKSQTKPYKDILNGLKKELTNTESSLSKQLESITSRLHETACVKGYETKYEAIAAGARAKLQVHCFDLAKVPHAFAQEAIEYFVHDLVSKALKSGQPVPTIPGVMVEVEIPTFNIEDVKKSNSSNNDDGMEM